MYTEGDDTLQKRALQLLVARCPRLVHLCYFAGTSAIALEELHHRKSLDFDFHTTNALVDVRPILAELCKAFPKKVEVIETPDPFGSGFRIILQLSEKDPSENPQITIEVLSNFQDVPEEELVVSSIAPPLKRVSLRKYLADKIHCLVERIEARDLLDIALTLKHRPDLIVTAKRLLSFQDLLLLTERLQGWTDESLRADLEAYPDINPKRAREMRDTLLSWVKEICRENEAKA